MDLKAYADNIRRDERRRIIALARDEAQHWNVLRSMKATNSAEALYALVALLEQEK